MKYFLVCAVIFASALLIVEAALSEEQKARVEKASVGCRTKSGVEQDVILKARAGEFADDPKFKAHLLCFGKAIGLLDEHGVLQESVIKQKALAAGKSEEEVDKIIKTCSVQKATPEETAFEAAKCFFKNSPDRLFV